MLLLSSIFVMNIGKVDILEQLSQVRQLAKKIATSGGPTSENNYSI